MEKQNKNYFGLLIIPLIAVIYSMYYFTNIDWVNNEPLRAAITSGTETQTNFLTPTTMNRAQSAIDADGNTVVVWSMADASAADTTGQGVYYRRFDKNGIALNAADVLVNTSTTGDQQNPVVAMDENGNFIVVWEGAGNVLGQGDAEGVFLQAFQADGTAVGGEIRVNSSITDNQNTPTIGLDYDGPDSATRFVIGWRGFVAGFDYNLYYQLFDADFTQTASAPGMVGSETTAYTTTEIETVTGATMNNLGEFALVWSQDNGAGTVNFYYTILAQDGSILVSKTLLNSETSGATPSVATDKMPRPSLDDPNGRSFIFTYGDSSNNLYVIRQACTDPNTSNGTDTDVTCSQDGSKLIINDATVALSKPSVSADYLGNFTVAWEETGSDGSGTGIMSQSFNYQGKRIDQNVNVNTTIIGDQSSASVAMNTDGFYLISFEDVSNNDNLFQNYITEIFKTDTETLAHTSSPNSQGNVNTAVSINGNIVVVWKDVTANRIKYSLYELNTSTVPPTYTAVKTNTDAVVSGGNVDNPSVSFFKDTAGTGSTTFVIAWDDDTSGDKGIYYRLFDANGDPVAAAEHVDSAFVGEVTDIRVNPDVAAGYYTADGAGGGGTISELAIGWENQTDGSFEAAYNNNGISTNTLNTCTNCGDIQVDFNPMNDYTIFAWQADNLGNNEVFIRQATGSSLTGSALQISPAPLNNGDPDLTFISSDDYVVTYTEITSGSTADVYGITYQFGGGGPTSAGTRFNMTQFPPTTDTEFSTAVTGDPSNDRFLAVWNDAPTVSANDVIFGQFYNFTGSGGTNVTTFGPTFRVNSTLSGNQILPTVNMNGSGQISVAWEGNYDQGGTTDTNGVIYQILQDPQNQQTVLELTPTAQQEIQAGGQFLDVPTTISFPDVALSATDSTVQTVSVRDATYGGDTKYVEIQDATGVDFTFTVQTGDFFSTADGKSYIKNDQHFRVKNWDNDLTNINAGDCDNASTPTDPDMCFTTVESTVTPTAFTLNNTTQNFGFADSQVVLAEKQGTTDNEIGRWRIYPKFEITIPPLIPPGIHSAQITFTLT